MAGNVTWVQAVVIEAAISAALIHLGSPWLAYAFLLVMLAVGTWQIFAQGKVLCAYRLLYVAGQGGKRAAFLEGLRAGWNSAKGNEAMDDDYAERSWLASDASLDDRNAAEVTKPAKPSI